MISVKIFRADPLFLKIIMFRLTIDNYALLLIPSFNEYVSYQSTSLKVGIILIFMPAIKNLGIFKVINNFNFIIINNVIFERIIMNHFLQIATLINFPVK